MITGYLWACSIVGTNLPTSISDIEKRTALVNEINSLLFTAKNSNTAGKNLEELDPEEKAKRLSEIAERSKAYVSGELDDRVRKNLLLRLWAGCLDAAKNIALETMDGPNNPNARHEMSLQIDLFAKIDPIYRAGTETAPSFKKLHRQYYSFNGVPVNSPVRKFPNEYLLNDDISTC